jgi:hypothetical protein
MVLLLNSDFCGTNGTTATWAYHAGDWTNITAITGSQPPAREFSQMAWDPSSQAVVVFSGISRAYHPLNDTWEFKNGVWSNVTLNSTRIIAPAPVTSAGFTADPAVGAGLLFGGTNASGYPTNSTDAFESGSWMRINPEVSPTARSGPALAFDTSLGGIVLFGGSYGPEGPGSDDTWLYSGGVGTAAPSWSALDPAQSPIGLTGTAMAYDSVSQELLLFGGIGPTGFSNQTWALVNVTAPTAGLQIWALASGFALAETGGVMAIAIVARFTTPKKRSPDSNLSIH